MATSQGITKAMAILAMVWPTRVDRLTDSAPARALAAAAFRTVDDRDLETAAGEIASTVAKLWPDDNLLGILQEFASGARADRLERERAEDDKRRRSELELEELETLAQPLTDEERDYFRETELLDHHGFADFADPEGDNYPVGFTLADKARRNSLKRRAKLTHAQRSLLQCRVDELRRIHERQALQLIDAGGEA